MRKESTAPRFISSTRVGSRIHWALAVTAIGIVYYGSARLGLLLKLPGTNASPVWPSSGIGLAALFLFGIRCWPGIAAGAFLANLLTLPSSLTAAFAAGMIAVGNSLEELVAFVFIQRLVPSGNPFDRPKDVFLFVGTAAVAAIIASTNGTLALSVLGLLPIQLCGQTWFTWWLGDLAGMLILTPTLFCWWNRPGLGLTGSRLMELIAVIVLATGITELLFGGWLASVVVASLPYLVVPSLLWSAFRFGQRETTLVALIVSTLAVGHTWNNMKAVSTMAIGERIAIAPFVAFASTPNESLLMLQIFVSAIAVTAISLAAAMAERNRSENDLLAANLSLVKAEALFRTIFEQAAVGVALIESLTGRFRRINNRYCEIIGYSSEEIVTKTFQEITYLEDLQADLDNMTKLLAGQICEFALEKRYRRKDGAVIWVKLMVSPTWQSGETPEHHIAIVIDITAQKAAEREIRNLTESLEQRVADRTTELEATNQNLQLQIGERQQAEAKARGLLESAPDAMVITNQAGMILMVNSQTEKLFGYVREELLGRPVECLLPQNCLATHMEHQPDSTKIHAQVMGAGLDLYGVRKDGARFPIEISLSPLQTDEGWGVSSTIRDITDRRKIELALRESEKRFTAFMNHSPSLAWMKDVCGRYIYVNQPFEQFHRSTLEAMKGKDDFALLPEDVAEEIRRNDQNVLATGEVLEAVEVVPNPDGHRYEWLVFRFPVHEASGERFVGGLAVDITDRRRNEMRLETSLQEKVLLLEEVHHRVKNNMQVISSLLDLQGHALKDARILPIFKETQNRIKSMALVHEQLYGTDDLTAIDFSGYIRTLVQSLFHSHRAHGRSIASDLQLNSVRLTLDDAIPCGLILNELISNALKHAFPNNRAGTVRVRLHSHDENVVILSVGDDGVGLADPLDINQTSTLGFQLVSRLTKQLNGILQCDRLNGTTFRIQFSIANMQQQRMAS